MNIQQLEYIVAVDRYRHFVQAAEHCHVTQPTLSMMIRKLEDELGVKIFDRARQPILPTEIGVRVIAQAQVILRESARLAELANQYKDLMAGELRVGIIPTIAPYLLPQFIQNFMEKYPAIHLQITEMITDRVLHELKSGTIDVGIVATLAEGNTFQSAPLYREKLFVYASERIVLYEKKYILPEDIDPNELWLLEEGHCFRTQIQKLCELSRTGPTGHSLSYRAGNIETLIRMVERSGGLTIIPELAVLDLVPSRLAHVREFQAPAPAREIHLIYNREHVKTRLIEVLREDILTHIPEEMKLKTESLRVL
ncbi:LysR substrate-binding domain-containing protein [Salmonirosea aquatica]|uniref:LysR family transcriptional regulator n=1 Tax=Salmonirosea aquatica TaxID=2654236 RepID=A0A7C9FS49_9BACT|nr:LysR family transcriptional regulator [Cytophagaceae bacterium SJW1-29]